MCEPTTLFAVSLAIAAASAIATDQGQRQEAKSQRAYQEAQMRAHNEAALHNAQAAIQEQNEQSAAENTQLQQQMEAAAREKQKNQVEMLQKRGMALASSPNAGGLSFDALMADFERQKALNNDVVQQQLEMQGVSTHVNKTGFRDQAQNRIRSQQAYIPSPITMPNTLATALSFGGNALNSYNAATNYGRTPLSSKAGK